MSARDKINAIDHKLRTIGCKLEDLMNSIPSDYVISLDSLEVLGGNLVIRFTNETGPDSISGALPISSELEIKYNVLNYNELLTVTGQDLYDFAYVREDQGTPWLPGGLGGTYYGNGLYIWNGTEWTEDDTDVFNQLQQVLDTIATLSAVAFSGSYIDLSDKPDADQIDDSTTTNKFITQALLDQITINQNTKVESVTGTGVDNTDPLNPVLTISNGVDGLDGRTILNGTVPPSSGIGVEGDFYIDTVANRLWGPKGVLTWNTGFIELVGPQGPVGPQGIQGPQGNDGADSTVPGPQGPQGDPGPQGIQGIPGNDGVDGTNGTNGVDGADGADGLSAYQVWLNEGNTGTEQDFLDSLEGPQGPQGVQGIQGPQGDPGADGTNGTNGVDGQDGADGAQGPPGPIVGLNGLTDTNLPTPAIGDRVTWDGTNWVNTPEPIDEFVEATLTINIQLPAGTAYQNVIVYDTPDVDTITGGTFNNATGIFTVSTAGLYRFDFQTTLDQYDGNNRTSARVRLALNNTLVKGTEQIGYHRQNLHGFNNYSFTKSLSLIPGDQVRVQARNEDGARDHQLLANSTLFRITRLKQ